MFGCYLIAFFAHFSRPTHRENVGAASKLVTINKEGLLGGRLHGGQWCSSAACSYAGVQGREEGERMGHDDRPHGRECEVHTVVHPRAVRIQMHLTRV